MGTTTSKALHLLQLALHLVEDRQGVLAELHRVLKPGGSLYFSDHHMDQGEAVGILTAGELFELEEQSDQTFQETFHFKKR